jgi:hypothetical protein
VDNSIVEDHITSIFGVEVRRMKIWAWCVEGVYSDPQEGTADRA